MSGMKLSIVSLIAAALLAFAACGDSTSYVQDRPIETGGTFVTVQGLSTQEVDTIAITAVASSNNAVTNQLLTYSKGSGGFSGYLVLAPDSYGVTALAYVGGSDGGVRGSDGGSSGLGTLVGRVSTVLTVQSGSTSSLNLDIRDTSARQGQGDIPPIITQLAVSKMRVSPNEAVQLTASAVDLDGDAISWQWKDDCGGTFSAARSSTSSWQRSASGGCTVTLVVTSRGVSNAKSASVVVVNQADGTVGVGGQFFARPQVEYVSATATWADGGFSNSNFYRFAQLPYWAVPMGAQIQLQSNWSSGAGDAGISTVAFSSSCPGTYAPQYQYSSSPGEWYADGIWQTVNQWTDGGTLACKVTATVANQRYPELNDAFSFGVELY